MIGTPTVLGHTPYDWEVRASEAEHRAEQAAIASDRFGTHWSCDPEGIAEIIGRRINAGQDVTIEQLRADCSASALPKALPLLLEQAAEHRKIAQRETRCANDIEALCATLTGAE